MSTIEKINIGVSKRRERNNLSQDTTTTMEVGYIQPTFCRELVQKTHVSIDCKSLVRLSPLSVPTFGRMSLRHYFSFVDYATLWTPFEALRTANNYTYADGSVQTPYAVPQFNIKQMYDFVLDSSRVTTQPKLAQSFYCTLYKNGTRVTGPLGTELTNLLGVSMPFNFPLYYLQISTAQRISSITSTIVTTSQSGVVAETNNWVIITNKNADFSFNAVKGTDNYMFLCKYTNFGRRLRDQFIGCGYSFNPFNTTMVTPLKLFALYKSWFDLFAVQRQINFNNTNCYKIMKMLSDTAPYSYLAPNIFYGYSGLSPVYETTFLDFVCDLPDICYVLPPDYFSASDVNPNRGGIGTDPGSVSAIHSPNLISVTPADDVTVSAGTNRAPQLYVGNWNNAIPAQGIEMAQTMLRFSNKRSVIGRKVSELLALEGVSDPHNLAHESVHHLGSCRIDVQISDVISQADTSSASLGDFAGRGIGFKDSETFIYDTPSQGVLICMSCIVPTSGYFQGMLKENTDKERFDFFTEEFDALGYQSLAMYELISDNQFGGRTGNGSNLGNNTGYLGLVPRYQHKRIGRNICNGDISLPSMQSVMLPYNLDRHFPTCVPVDGTDDDFVVVTDPVVTAEAFRRVQADTGYGDYNRIFQYQAPDYDHFIVHVVFNVPIVSPLLSVGNAYDTFQEDDNKALEFAHE